MTDNNILYIGPPGTGKTYSAIHEAEEYAKDKKCREIIYFHPGYSYQDFIKGIDVSANKSGNIVYASADKVFLELCKKANDEQNKKNNLQLFWTIYSVPIFRVFSASLCMLSNTEVRR